MGLQQGGGVCVGALHGDGECSSTTLQKNENEEQGVEIQTEILKVRHTRQRLK